MDNYRPVTLLPAFLKCFERILQSRILKFIDTKQIKFPCNQQQGFQKELSCITAGFNLQETINYNNDRGSNTFAAFLDTRKAFDTVWHSALMVKVHDLGIKGKLWRIICNAYTNLISAVRLHRQKSRWFSVRQGVRQGGVLSSFLYLVFIDELLNKLVDSNLGCKIGTTDCCCPTLADDLTCLACTPRRLQRMLDIVHQYTTQWRYEINSQKSHTVIFSKHTRALTQSLELKLGQSCVPQASQVVHLGILQCGTGSLIARTKDRCQKAKNAFYSMSRYGVHRHGLNPVVATSLYRKVIIPTLTYGSELWNSLRRQDNEELNKLQHYIVKRIQGFNVRVRSDMCEAMVGLNRITAEVDKRKLIFLQKLLSSNHTTVSKQIFTRKLFMYLDGEGAPQSGFIPDIMDILQKYDLLNYLYKAIETLQVPSKIVWKNTVQKAVYARETVLWRNRISNDPDFIRFQSLHSEIKTASIYRMHKNRSDSKLTMNIARLWVITRNPSVTCTFCSRAYTDLLRHAVFDCPVTSQHFQRFRRHTVNQFGPTIAGSLFDSDENILACLLGARGDPDHWDTGFGRHCMQFMQGLSDLFV